MSTLHLTAFHGLETALWVNMSDNEGSRRTSARSASSTNSRAALPPRPIEESVLSQLRIDFGDDDGSLTVGLIDAFAESADTFELASALPESFEPSTLAQQAQRLRGAALMVGAQQVARLCQELELASHSSDRERLDQLNAELTVAISAANEALARRVLTVRRIEPSSKPK